VKLVLFCRVSLQVGHANWIVQLLTLVLQGAPPDQGGGARRPESRVGILMTFVAFCLLERKLQYSHGSAQSTFGFLFGELVLHRRVRARRACSPCLPT
jgi:hypothetical protein